MQEFLFNIHKRADHQDDWSPEQHRDFLLACEKYIEMLRKEKKLIAAQPLMRTGAIVRGTSHEWQQTKLDPTDMQVGYYHIRAKDLDDAIAIAKANPEFAFGTTASIEIHPIKMEEEETGYVYPHSI